jgi:hypothetical protein
MDSELKSWIDNVRNSLDQIFSSQEIDKESIMGYSDEDIISYQLAFQVAFPSFYCEFLKIFGKMQEVFRGTVNLEDVYSFPVYIYRYAHLLDGFEGFSIPTPNQKLIFFLCDQEGLYDCFFCETEDDPLIFRYNESQGFFPLGYRLSEYVMKSLDNVIYNLERRQSGYPMSQLPERRNL